MSQSSPSSLMKRLARSRWPSPLLLLALWELGSLAGVIPRRTLTSPHEVSRTLVNMALSSELAADLLFSTGNRQDLHDKINVNRRRGTEC